MSADDDSLSTMERGQANRGCLALERDRPAARTEPDGERGRACAAEDQDAARLGVDAASSPCVCCIETGRTCPSCVQRRRYAWALVTERDETVESAARIMNLAAERVRELVAQENDRRELRSLRCDSIPVDLTRAAIADALA